MCGVQLLNVFFNYFFSKSMQCFSCLPFNVHDFKASACKARRGLTRGGYGPPFEKISDASRFAKWCKSRILVSHRMLRTPRRCLFEVLIDHFTVVGLVTARLELALFWYRPHCLYCANQVVLMLTSWHLHENCREVCIKARLPPASLAFMARYTAKHTTVKWPI